MIFSHCIVLGAGIWVKSSQGDFGIAELAVECITFSIFCQLSVISGQWSVVSGHSTSK
ncbi:MAG: hypothetical protein ACKPFD_20610 [Dolichospermum sp.]